MELNVIPAGDQPLGALATEDMAEGRGVIFTSHTWSADFGSLEDIPGVKLPATSAEAGRVRYVVTWTPPERYVDVGTPLFEPQPAQSYALRGGFDQTANLPMTSTTVRFIHPGNQDGVTIPSGTKVMVLGPGAVVTLKSGEYNYSASLETPGALIEALNTADDTAANAGLLSYNASGTVAEVLRFDSSDAALTVRLIG